MILTRTPLRISLFGGGTDVPEFYMKNGYGCVLSFAINKYIHVTVNEKFDGGTRVSYAQTENVNEPGDLKHDLARECLKHFGLRGLEITSVADVPGEGSGLGSSSAFAVGLVRALDAHIDRDNNRHPTVYAETAYEIERLDCKHQVGKQDHYASAYGGLHFFKFKDDDSVTAELMKLAVELKYFLEENVMLFWTGRTRRASPLLEEQVDRLLLGTTNEAGLQLRDLAEVAHNVVKDGNLSILGTAMNEAWEWKKKMTWVSDDELDAIYTKAKEAGAEGGKILGAGMGGFMIFIADKKYQAAIENAIGLRRVRFSIDERGSTVVYRGPQ